MRLAFALALAASAPAAADVLVPEQAREASDRGRALYDAGDYTGAIAAYDEAYALAPRPGLLFDLAQAYRRAGNCDDAAYMYRRYLESDGLEPATRAIAEQNLPRATACGHGGLAIAQPRMPAVIAPDPPGRSHLRDIGTYVGAAGLGMLVAGGVFAWSAASASPGERDHDTVIAATCGALGGAALISGAILFGVGHRRELSHVAIAPTSHGGAVSVAWRF